MAGGLYYTYSVAGFFGVRAPSEPGPPNADFVRMKIRRSPHVHLYISPGSARSRLEKRSSLWNVDTPPICKP
jgi:hypothetical protein